MMKHDAEDGIRLLSVTAPRQEAADAPEALRERNSRKRQIKILPEVQLLNLAVYHCGSHAPDNAAIDHKSFPDHSPGKRSCDHRRQLHNQIQQLGSDKPARHG